MATYTPRLTSAGISGNFHYESQNPFYIAGWPMPNCTAYAFGRFWEIADPNNDMSNYPTLSTGNAEDWYNHSDGYSRGSVPKLGAVACYADGIWSGDGHVCIVEEIDLVNQRCLVSESAYNGYYFRASHYIDYDGSYDDGSSGYVFQGFIYNPYAGDTPGPPLTGVDRIWRFRNLIWKKKGKIIT